MKVGDTVKSLDFVGIPDCYMVGKVIAIQGDGLFRAKFVERVWQGAVDRKFKTDYFTAPMQGNHLFDRPGSPRVTVI